MVANNGTQYVPPGWVTNNVLYGTGFLWVATYGTALPADVDLGDSTKWLAVASPGPWKYVGATQQGVTTAFNPSVTDLYVEEQAVPVAALVNTATFQITTSLSEDTLNNIQLAHGNAGTQTVTAPGVAQPGKTVLNLSTTFPILAAAVVSQNALGFPRVMYVPKIQSAGAVSTAYRRAAEQRLLPLTLNALCDMSLVQVIDVTAAGS